MRFKVPEEDPRSHAEILGEVTTVTQGYVSASSSDRSAVVRTDNKIGTQTKRQDETERQCRRLAMTNLLMHRCIEFPLVADGGMLDQPNEGRSV